MKNIRRFIIVLTLAVIAMIMMTAVSFAGTTVEVDGQAREFSSTTIWGGGTSVEFIRVDEEPESIKINSDEVNEWHGISTWTIYSLPVNKDVLWSERTTIDDMGFEPSEIETMGLSATDKIYGLMDSAYRNVILVIQTGEESKEYFGLKDISLDGIITEPTDTVDNRDAADDPYAAMFFRVDKAQSFSALCIEGFTVKDYNSVNYNSTVSAGKTASLPVFLISNDSTFAVEPTVAKEMLGYFGRESEYRASHKYRVIAFKGNDNIPVYVIYDIGDPFGPAAEITGLEQIDENSVMLEFSGEGLDFTAIDTYDSWFISDLKNSDGESIPAAYTAEIVDANHVKISYDIDLSYENSLGDEAGTANMQIMYDGAAESKSFDVTIPSSRFWSKYTEVPEKIAKGNKDWPEFVGYYKISTPGELAWFAALVNGDLEEPGQNREAKAFLADDIECNDTEGWESWNEDTTGIRVWNRSIGTTESPFGGIFDGNGHTVSGLFMILNNTMGGPAALFPEANNAEIRNIGVDESYISNIGAVCRAGGIVGRAVDGIVENCWFGGTVDTGNNSQSFAGGIVARCEYGKVSSCFNAGTVISQAGSGIVGDCYANTIENCYNTGTVSTCGIASGSSNGTITSCYTLGNKPFATSSNKTIARSYNLDTAPAWGQGVTPVSAEELRALPEGLYKYAFCKDGEGDDAINDGYPVLIWQTDLYSAKKAAIKEVKYFLDPAEYSMSKDELETVINNAIENIEAAEDESAINSIKEATIASLREFKTNADISGENNDEIERLKKEIADIKAVLELHSATVTVAEKSVVYDGKAKEPAVIVTGKSGVELVAGTDYTVVYTDNIKPGIAKVTVTGTGAASSESKEASFKILPKKASLKKLKAAKKSLKVTWAKDAAVTGYEVQYGLKKNFKGAKKINIKKAGTVKTTIKKLKSGKKYFVRIRSYKTVGKGKIYGEWSKGKNAKVK